MTKLESLQDIKDTDVRLQETFMGSDIESIKTAEKAFQQLIDWFYQKNEDIMAPQQYKAAKDDPDYFLMLINLVCYHEEHEKVDKQGDQSLYYFNWKLFTQI